MTEDETFFFFLSLFCFVFCTLIPLFLTAPSGSILYFSLLTHKLWVWTVAGWAPLKSSVCVSPVVWAIKVSIYSFLCDRLLTLTHCYSLLRSVTHTHAHTHSNANKNSSISKTPSHFDLQHLRPFTITQDRVYRAMPKSETFEFLPTVGWDIKGVKLYFFN